MSSFVFELAVGRIICQPGLVLNTDLNDMRLSISLSDFPILHISPRLPVLETNDTDQVVLFNGSGKLWEFNTTRSAFDKLNMVLLFLKEVSSINDHLILAMTPALSVRDLLLSLPSGNDYPLARRNIEFLDGKGSCDILIRMIRLPHISQGKQKLLTIRSKSSPSKHNETETLTRKTEDQVHKTSLSRREPKPDVGGRLLYGGFRKRNPLI